MAIRWKEGELDDLRKEIARYNRKIENMYGDWYDPVMVRPSNYRRVLCVMETKDRSYHYFIGFYDNKQSAWFIDRSEPIRVSSVILWCDLPPVPVM